VEFGVEVHNSYIYISQVTNYVSKIVSKPTIKVMPTVQILEFMSDKSGVLSEKKINNTNGNNNNTLKIANK
jgi:hypothetical protein